MSIGGRSALSIERVQIAMRGKATQEQGFRNTVAIDSQTGFIHVVPLGSQGQFRLIAQELMNFSQLLGYSAITYRSDNEPTTRQILKMLINARQSLGRTTRLVNSKLGDGSFLSENTVDRAIEGVQSKTWYQDWIRSCTSGLGQQDVPVCAQQISASQRSNSL